MTRLEKLQAKYDTEGLTANELGELIHLKAEAVFLAKVDKELGERLTQIQNKQPLVDFTNTESLDDAKAGWVRTWDGEKMVYAPPPEATVHKEVGRSRSVISANRYNQMRAAAITCMVEHRVPADAVARFSSSWPREED